MDPTQFNLISQLFSTPQSNVSLPSNDTLKAVLEAVAGKNVAGGGAASSSAANSDPQATTSPQMGLSSFRIPKKTKPDPAANAAAKSADTDWMIEVYDAPVAHGQNSSRPDESVPRRSSEPDSNYHNSRFDERDRHFGNGSRERDYRTMSDDRNPRRLSSHSSHGAGADDTANRFSDDRQKQQLHGHGHGEERQSGSSSLKRDQQLTVVQGLRIPTSLSVLVPRYDVLSYLKQAVTDFRRTWRHNYRTERHWNGWAYNFRGEARDKLAAMCGGTETQEFKVLAAYLDNKLAMKVHTGVQKAKKTAKRKKGRKKGAGHYNVEKQYDCHHGFRADYRPDKHDVKVMREINRVLNNEYDDEAD